MMTMPENPVPSGVRRWFRPMDDSPIPLAAIVAPGGQLPPEVVARHAEALRQFPEVVLSCTTPTLPQGDAVEPVLAAGNTPAVVDGRTVARSVVLNAADRVLVPRLVLVRWTALGDADRWLARDGAPEAVAVQWYSLLLDLLVRGAAWFDPVPGTGWPVADGLALWRQWPAVITKAERLGLLDEPGDRALARVASIRRASVLARTGMATKASPAPAVGLVREAVEAWRTGEGHDAEACRLPLRVVIQSEGTDTSAAAVQPPVHQFDVVEATDRPAAETPIAFPAQCDVPTLVVRPGEAVEVRDQAQLSAVLQTAAVDNLRVATPEGKEPRLHRPDVVPGPSPSPPAGTGHLLHSLRLVRAGSASLDWLPRPSRKAPPQRLDTFVVVAPDYTESHAGVVALHRLCDRLNAIGYQAFIHPIGRREETRPGWLTPLWRGRSLRDAVVVYPEIVTGNLLGAERVVRWLLNRPARLTGSEMEERPSDLLVSFSSQVSREHPILSLPLVDPDLFFPKDMPGEGGLLWVGKGTLPPDFDRSTTTLITDRWPRSRRRLGQVLRGADVLYTCDWLTTLIDEALMCGTPVVLVGDQDWDGDDLLMRPGMSRPDEPLDRARREVGSYFPDYVAGLATVNDAVERFVQSVNDHFGSTHP